MAVTRSWQQFFTVPFSNVFIEKTGNSAALPTQCSLALKGWWAFSEIQNTENSESWSVQKLLLIYQRNMLVIYIFLALAYPPKTNLNSENCVVHSIYYYYCILSAGLTELWRPRTFSRGQTRTEHNPVTATKSHNQHLHVLPIQQN